MCVCHLLSPISMHHSATALLLRGLSLDRDPPCESFFGLWTWTYFVIKLTEVKTVLTWRWWTSENLSGLLPLKLGRLTIAPCGTPYNVTDRANSHHINSQIQLRCLKTSFLLKCIKAIISMQITVSQKIHSHSYMYVHIVSVNICQFCLA